MADTLEDWLSHPTLVWCLVGFSLFAILASVALVPRYLASLPEDFLRADAPSRRSSLAFLVARNLLGTLLVLLGLLMLVLPGQGLLTLLVGLLVVDLPGKHRLAVGILARPKILSIVNQLRAHRHAPPLAP